MAGIWDDSALVQHEFFSSYVRAGFTRPEALELVKVFLNYTLNQSALNSTGEAMVPPPGLPGND